MFPAQVSSSPWGLASRVCFIPTPNSLGGSGLGCCLSCAKLAAWPCSPASSSLSPLRAQHSLPPGLQLTRRAFLPESSPRAGQAGKQGLLTGEKSPKSPSPGAGRAGPFSRGGECGRDSCHTAGQQEGRAGRDVRIPCALCAPDIRVPGSAAGPQPVWASPCCQLLLLDETCPFPEAGLTHIPFLPEPSGNGG